MQWQTKCGLEPGDGYLHTYLSQYRQLRESCVMVGFPIKLYDMIKVKR